MRGPALGRLSNTAGLQQGRVLPVLPTGQETFAKSAQLSAPDQDMGIWSRSFHKYLLSSHYVPGPGIAFLPLPVVLGRNTDSEASRLQASNKNEREGEHCSVRAWWEGGSSCSILTGPCPLKCGPTGPGLLLF